MATEYSSTWLVTGHTGPNSGGRLMDDVMIAIVTLNSEKRNRVSWNLVTIVNVEKVVMEVSL
jgi:hypothetical protein